MPRPPVPRTPCAPLLLILCCAAFRAAARDDAGWPLHGHDYANTRYSPLAQIDTCNVTALEPAWILRTGKAAAFQTTPLVVDDTMILTTPFNDIIAVDAATGAERWRYRHDLRTRDTCCGPANRGAAVANGRVYMATMDARLVALDLRNGARRWDVTLADTAAGAGEVIDPLLGIPELEGAVQTGQTGYSANMAPQVYGDLVIVGVTGAGYGLHLGIDEEGREVLAVGGLSGGAHGLRGFLAAFDGRTGREVWRWYTVPERGWEGDFRPTTPDGKPLHRDIAAERAAFRSYHGTWRYGGGSIWTTPAIDERLGLLYIGTGNPSPQMDDSTRPGDNLYTVSLVALDLATGTLRWHYQQVPHDRWGYDVASPPVLFDFHRDGRVIPAVGQAGKTGWLYIHDRATGALLLRSEPFVRQENLFAPPDEDGERIVPGTLGATSWSPVALHPGLELAYIAGIHQPSEFFSRKLTPTPGRPWQSYTFFKQAQEPDHGVFTAISTRTGRIAWQRRVADPMVGGALATAGGLVFTGEGNGRFDAFDAATGELLWHYQASAGVNAPPITYAVNGRQYVAVAAGGNSLFGYATGDELLVFALPR
jgi:glucose dehydrogenase